MTIEKLIEGLRANYPEALHPTEIAQQDLARALLRMGWLPEQLEKLYLDLLANCSYFPKVYDIHRATERLRLEKAGDNQVERTKQEFRKWDEGKGEALTLKQFLWEKGGYEEMLVDCGGDERELARRLRVMGVLEIPEGKGPRKRQEMREREPGEDDDPASGYEWQTEVLEGLDDL